MYCVFLGKAVQTVNPPSGSVGLSQLSATGTPSSSTFLRGDNSWVAAGGANTPAFFAKVNASNSTTDSVPTKMTFATEVFDTDNAYDTSTSRFTVPSGKAGKYFIYSAVRVDSATDSEIYDITIRKNGSGVLQHSANQYRYTSAYVSGVLDLAVSDYLEIYVQLQNNLSIRNEPTGVYFGGYKIIE
jgi:hypothetical protein